MRRKSGLEVDMWRVVCRGAYMGQETIGSENMENPFYKQQVYGFEEGCDRRQ